MNTILEKATSKKIILLINAVYFVITLLPICKRITTSAYAENPIEYYNAFQMGALGIVWILLPAIILLLITTLEKQMTTVTDMAYMIVCVIGLIGVFGAPRKYAAPWGKGTKWCLLLYLFYITLLALRLMKARLKNTKGESL